MLFLAIFFPPSPLPLDRRPLDAGGLDRRETLGTHEPSHPPAAPSSTTASRSRAPLPPERAQPAWMRVILGQKILCRHSLSSRDIVCRASCARSCGCVSCPGPFYQSLSSRGSVRRWFLGGLAPGSSPGRSAARPSRRVRQPRQRASRISAILSGHVCRVPGFTNAYGRFFWIFGYLFFEFLDFSL